MSKYDKMVALNAERSKEKIEKAGGKAEVI